MPVIPCGYYIKARCIKDSWIAHASPVMREVWDYLLRTANHEDKKYSGFLVKRGQLFRSYAEIRDDLSWKVGYRTKRYSEDQMKHCMKMLRTQLMITLTKTPRGNLITVLNYDKFQDPKNYESTNESTNESTIDPPTIHQQPPSINKNDKNKKKDIGISPKSKKQFTPPTEQETIQYFIENGYKESAAKTAWDYYESGDWIDSRGTKVKNWKQKMRGVWFKDENLDNSKPKELSKEDLFRIHGIPA